MTDHADRFLMLTAEIVSAYLDANPVAAPSLPDLIRNVHRSLAHLASTGAGAPVRSQLTKSRSPGHPKVDIRKSVFPDRLVCLEDGKSVTMLKRHLMTAHGLTPEAYRAKWDLPADYPMVAPNYAKVRSRLAKEAGLGKRR